MVEDNKAAGGTFGTLRYIGDGDLTEVTLSEDNWQEIYSVQSSKSLKYFAGYGTTSRDGESGWSDFDAEATGSGALSDGDELNVEFRWAVYNDANKDDLAAIGPKMDSSVLRAAVGEAITDKVMVGSQAIGAPEDGYLALEVKAKDSNSDGAIIESDGGTPHSGTLLDTGFAYTEMRT